MTPTLNSRLALTVAGLLENPLDLATASAPLTLTEVVRLSSGTGAGQADRIFHDRRPIAASSNDDLDLADGLLDPLGGIFTIVKVKALIVVAAAANVNNVVVGAAASNPWIGPFGGAAHTQAVKPGGWYVNTAPDAAGWAVTPGAADVLRFANGAGSAVSYDLVIIGTSG